MIEALTVRLGSGTHPRGRALADLDEPEKARPLLDRALKTLSDASVPQPKSRSVASGRAKRSGSSPESFAS